MKQSPKQNVGSINWKILVDNTILGVHSFIKGLVIWWSLPQGGS